MDYKLIKTIFTPVIEENFSSVAKSRQQLETIQAQNTFDKNVLAIFKNIHKNIEVCESLKKVVRAILEQGDFFSDASIHQSTKNQALKKILTENNFVEANKQFNLSTLQTYLENILHKQLYEINIKIEENQRALNNLSFSGPSKAEPEGIAEQNGKYILVESERVKCAVRIDTIVEILKFPAPFPKRSLVEFTMIYNKVCGANRKYVIKHLQDEDIGSSQVLGNANMTLKNKEDKNFALIHKKENEYTLLFVDYVLYTNPVAAVDKGGFIKTREGTYKIIEV